MMSSLQGLGIREVLLEVIREQTPKSPSDQTLQQGTVLDVAARRLGAMDLPDLEEAILTEWYDLFRTGLLSWGYNLCNQKHPFFHVTSAGRGVLEHLARDPSNPAAYLRHLSSIAVVPPVAQSYLLEALECYRAGLVKAGAVMVGAAAESLLLSLRDAVTLRLESLGRSVPKGLSDWRAKTVADALRHCFSQHQAQLPRELQDALDANWGAFTHQIRTTRNDAGHPTSIDPVTPDMVHAALLVFPEIARLTTSLTTWVTENL